MAFSPKLLQQGASGAAAADPDSTYQISRSLRFNSPDSAYLNRTPASASNRTTWTWSGWVKRSGLAATITLFATNYDTNIGDGDSTIFRFSSTDNLAFIDANTLITVAVFRDVSAWYHIVLSVDTTQATQANRVKLYVNNVQQTVTGTYPSQNDNTFVNSTNIHSIGGSPVNNGVPFSFRFQGYMADVYLIDGQALTPSSFGETNARTGVWQPKAYSGSYGTNGFYLNFSDNSNTTAATLGKDYSGNGNNWTPNNFSVTAGAGNDSLVDSPTSYGTNTGVGGEVRGNYGTLNPLNIGTASSLSNGSLTFSSTSSVGNIEQAQITGTFAIPSSGKWYFEATPTSLPVSIYIGVATVTHSMGSTPFSGSPIRAYRSSTGNKSNGGTDSAYGNTYTTSDVIGVAVDMDAGSIYFYKNNTIQNSGTPAFTDLAGTTWIPYCVAGSSGSTVTGDFNFGQRPFAYTAPSGYKALCTRNLPVPTIGATSATLATQFFAPVIYTGTGATQSVTVGFQPDWVWIKNRTLGANWHVLTDSVRGIQKEIYTNSTAAETTLTTTGVNQFNSSGFQILGNSNDYNGSTSNYVAWNWKAGSSTVTNTLGSITSTVSASTTSGFSVVTYTGTGANATVGHGLGVAPSIIIFKNRSATTNWVVYNINATSAAASARPMYLNTTNSEIANGAMFNHPSTNSSTIFNIGTDSTTNGSGNSMVAYCFTPIAGYFATNIFTGNGSADGPFVFCGFRPAYVLIKDTTNNGAWFIWDTARDTYNVSQYTLLANSSDAETSGSANYIDILSNGFKVKATTAGFNSNTDKFLFMAFASNPFKYSLAR